MASVEPNINFDCPECDERLSVSSEKSGNQIYCPHCGDEVHVPSQLSISDGKLAGTVEEDEIDHPGSLKIEGISSDIEDGSWNIKCHVCDSVLLVTNAQVGTKIKCNDCFSMLEVRPRKQTAQLEDSVADGSDLEVVEDETPAPVAEQQLADESDELTLMPAVDLAPEVANAQKETLIDELSEDEPPMELTEEHLDESEDPIRLEDPVSVAKTVNPMFGPPANAVTEEDDDEDSDEEIEMLDVSPEELNSENQSEDIGVEPVAVAPASTPTELPRMPRKGKQPNSIPVSNGEDEPPVRVHAKRRPKKETAAPPRNASANHFLFDEAPIGEILDKAVGVLKTGNVWMWALVSIAIMATGGAIYEWLNSNIDPEVDALSQRILYWGASWVCGQAIFFVGYILLLFVGGVIFRETALGETKLESVSVTDAADFTSTMLLFGFSMFIAALPCMMFGLMFVTLPFQFLLAGFFLFAAWRNQGAFLIITGSIFNSFAEHASSWKNWFVVTLILAVGAMAGGALMEVPIPVISVFTSIAGAILVAVVTLMFAAVSGWHCGHIVEKMRQAEQ